MSDVYQSIQVSINCAVATVSINNGPINLLDATLIKDLYKGCQQLMANDAVKVVVFESGNPDFFVAHADVNMIMAVANTPEPDGKTPSMLQALFEMIRHMPKVTIGKIEGIARGGGSELLLAMDMRFAAIGKTRISQPEVAMGLIAGGGACTRLPKLIGRARAMEVLLACQDYDAETAAQYGYVNRAINANDIAEYVHNLANRIASYPQHAIAATKRLVNGNEAITQEDFGAEYAEFYACATYEGMAQRMQHALDLGLQTYEKEIDDLGKTTDELPFMK
ncbi:MAG: enoyl-CoA hydratase/isomerase family protein [Glaciecola sp.]